MPDITPFDWHRILLSDEAPPLFLAEVALRSLVMYLLILGALRISGRRGVRQLSLFELTIILGLGSAAGDAMLYHGTPLLHALVVFAVVMGLYVAFNRLTELLPRFGDWLEGVPVQVVHEGRLCHEALKNERFTHKELFTELRQYQVEHLGQVRRAYLEATGQVSVFFYEPADTRPGLPIWPEELKSAAERIEKAADYACTECGYVATWPPAARHECPVCGGACWAEASTAQRVS